MGSQFGRRATKGGSNVGRHGADKRWRDEHGREWDSRLEGLVARWLDQEGIAYQAQPDLGLEYVTRVKQGRCTACGHESNTDIVQVHRYTPDFLVPEWDGAIIEVKGYFRLGVRPQLQELMKQNPGLPLRFVFSRNNPLKGLKRTPDYLSWAAYYGKPALVFNETRGLSEWLND